MKQKRIQTNRFLAMLLTVVMLLSMLPVSAMAEDDLLVDGPGDYIAAGKQIFSDRPATFADSIPAWLAGLNYRIVNMDDPSTTLTISKAGWMYVLTPANEAVQSAKSQKAALASIGFTHLTTLDAGVVSLALGEDLAVMEKQIMTGETVSVGSWCIIATSPTQVSVTPGTVTELQPLATVATESYKFAHVTSGKTIFNDRPATFASTIPAWMNGKSYIIGSMDNGVSVTTTSSGWVYVLTPASGIYGNNNSQVANLKRNGFSLLSVLPSNQISIGLAEEMAVMGKLASSGETISVGKWGILIADNFQEEISMQPPAVILNPESKLSTNPEYYEYLDGERLWQGIPSIAKDDESGRLWYTFYSGGKDEDEYNFCLLYTSKDDGVTWSGPKVVIDPKTPVRAYDPNLWLDPNGRLWFIWNQSYYWNDGRNGVWAMYTDEPEKEDPTWSDPFRLANGIAMNDPIVLTKDSGELKAGTWILPVAIWEGSDRADMQKEVHPNCYISTNQGMTWTYQGSVLNTEGQRTADENMIVQMADGSLRMWIRTTLGIEESFSADGGKTWTDSVNTGISTASSRFWVGWLDSETQLAVYNNPPDGSATRSHLTAAISTDGGKNWSHKLVIDERGGVSYPDVHIDDNGYIYISYDTGRTAEAEMVMAKITKEDIVGGELVNSGSKLKVLVNNNNAGALTEINVDIKPNLALIESTDEIKLFDKGVLIFNDRPAITGEYVPQQMIGMGYLFGSMDNGVSFTATTDGWVYVLTPSSLSCSQTTALTNEGFEKQRMLKVGQISPGFVETLDLMQREVKAGESFTIGKWSIVLVAYPVAATGVSLNTNQTEVIEEAKVQLTAVVQPDNATNKKVSWKSSNEKVATVDEKGLVTGIMAGETVITVTTDNGGFTAECTVTVKNKSVVEAEAAAKAAEAAQAAAEKAQAEAEAAQAAAEAAAASTASDKSAAEAAAQQAADAKTAAEAAKAAAETAKAAAEAAAEAAQTSNTAAAQQATAAAESAAAAATDKAAAAESAAAAAQSAKTAQDAQSAAETAKSAAEQAKADALNAKAAAEEAANNAGEDATAAANAKTAAEAAQKLAEEAQAAAEAAEKLAGDAKIAAENAAKAAEEQNVAAAKEAKTAADEALKAASAAEESAKSASESAGYAAAAASSAKDAQIAQKAAEEAQVKAEAAQKAAEEAQAKVESDKKAVEELLAKAEAAQKAAEEAQAKAEAAQKAAEEAQAKAEAAQKAEEDKKPGDEKPSDPTEPEKKENPFTDITEDMFCYDAVLWAYENEITTGKDATHFNPSGDCTRSQVVTFLWRAAGKPAPKSSENPFPDVATGKFYTEAVLWAVENGITAGFKDGTFGPDKTCTRDQIVTFLWRFAGKPEPKSTENTFPDVKADAFYTDAVLWAVENGITTGYKDGTFGPSKTCKRDQIVTFLYRYMAE